MTAGSDVSDYPLAIKPGWAPTLEQPGRDNTGKVVGVLLIIMLSCLHCSAQKPEGKKSFYLELETMGPDRWGMLSKALRFRVCSKLEIWLLQWNDKYPCQWLQRIMTDSSAGVCPSLTFPIAVHLIARLPNSIETTVTLWENKWLLKNIN